MLTCLIVGTFAAVKEWLMLCRGFELAGMSVRMLDDLLLKVTEYRVLVIFGMDSMSEDECLLTVIELSTIIYFKFFGNNVY
jgi:hypothetical protein